MRHFILPLLAMFLLGAAAVDPDPAKSIVAEYRGIPVDDAGSGGGTRQQRMETLCKLQSMSQADVAAAVRIAMGEEKESARRAELIDALSRIPGPATADVAVKALADPAVMVRRNAISCLRLYARRVDKSGSFREQRGPQTRPQVDGLVSDLIMAADDADETNRWVCLYALADTLDAAAVGRIRLGLKDPAEIVRFHAASFLSEFNDASGMAELKIAIKQLQQKNKNDFLRTMKIGQAITAMERLTGKSFGKLPMDPNLMSDSRVAARSLVEYDRVLDAWVKWWDWQPGAN